MRQSQWCVSTQSTAYSLLSRCKVRAFGSGPHGVTWRRVLRRVGRPAQNLNFGRDLSSISLAEASRLEGLFGGDEVRQDRDDMQWQRKTVVWREL
jgi:hypothetical protein